MLDITIGQYYETSSPIHKLDARTKLSVTLLFIVVLFFVTNFYGFLAAALFLLFVMLLSRIPLRYILRGLKPLVFIILITAVFNLFFTGGNVLWQWWIITITDEGLHNALFMCARLLLLVSATSLMTLSTSPIDLTDGMERGLSHVPFVKAYAHEISMMMSIALRFIPTLMEETDRIMKAQKSRGADFEGKGLIKKANSIIPILIPLFVSAFSRADDLALAMESRCYRGAVGRTKLKELVYHKRDAIAYVLALVVFGVMIATRFLF